MFGIRKRSKFNRVNEEIQKNKAFFYFLSQNLECGRFLQRSHMESHLWSSIESRLDEDLCRVFFDILITELGQRGMTLLEPTELAALSGVNKIVFHVKSNATRPAEYLRVTQCMVKASSNTPLDEKLRRPRVIQDIPLTVYRPGLAGVFLVCVRGIYDTIKLDVRLLIDKVDLYLIQSIMVFGMICKTREGLLGVRIILDSMDHMLIWVGLD